MNISSRGKTLNMKLTPCVSSRRPFLIQIASCNRLILLYVLGGLVKQIVFV